MEAIRKRNFLYCLLALFLTANVMIIKKSNIFEVLNDKMTQRNLLEQSKKDYVCDKAGDRLTDKYKTDFREDDRKKKSLSKAQQSIVDFIRDDTYDNIKPYIKHCAIFIVFMVLDIILIFVWISYCSCCCCSCCLFSDSDPSPCCSRINFLISVICNIIVLIISIVILGLLNSFFSRLNGLGCSTFKFIDHMQLGLAPSYTNRQSEWEGLDELINKLENTQEEARDLKTQSNYLNEEIGSKEKDYGEGEQCNTVYNTLKDDSNEINRLLSDSFDDISNTGAIEDLRDVSYTMQDAEDDAGDTIYDSMHDHINKWVKKIFIAIFTLTLIFSCLAISILCLYYFCKINIFRIIYIIIWNISMLLMYLSILASVLFGIIGYVFKDAAQVGQYILSTDNLNSTDPIVFESSDDYVSDLIDICANGNGSFIDVIEGGNELNENLEKWEQHKTNFERTRDNINCGNTSKTNELKGYYGRLMDIVDNSLNLSYNFTNISCSFAKNDKNILLNEADDGGKKGVGLCACSFLVGALLGISVIAGILLVHKYKVPKIQKIKLQIILK